MNNSMDFFQYEKDISEIVFTEQQIKARIKELAKEISQDFYDKTPICVGVLKGVFFFMADLLRELPFPLEVDFIAINNYTPNDRKQGVVRLVKDLDVSITGRHVLFIEDVIDTGLTLNYLLKNLRDRNPASISLCVLFNKPKLRFIETPIKYKGFDLPDRFVVGYGLDHMEKYRNLPYVGMLKAEAILNNDDQ